MSGGSQGGDPRSVRLGPGREFDAIRAMVEVWGDRARGIGDDAAVLEAPAGERIVVSTDAAVEGVHVRLGWMRPREIGWRAAAAALSDLAAMAATPLGVVVGLALPEGWRGELTHLAAGIGDACAHAAVPIVGGNLTASGEMSIVCTVIGSAAAPIPRSGARPGDAVYVTGRLGGPGAALQSLRRQEHPLDELRHRLVHPVPRLAEARWLAARGARAMIDISDGLAADLRHMAAASGALIVLELERVPLILPMAPEDAVRSGEEFELAVAGPAIDEAAFAREFELPLTRVGVVEQGPGELVVTRAGERVAPPAGYDHFSAHA
ncbi:MAG TPA: thiamine-phosphate kinase [Gemmatimonadaceae bacterium]|nr:thiamine-phosphate kinase [Gemmatimonadaceae bacterium]